MKDELPPEKLASVCAILVSRVSTRVMSSAFASRSAATTWSPDADSGGGGVDFVEAEASAEASAEAGAEAARESVETWGLVEMPVSAEAGCELSSLSDDIPLSSSPPLK